MSDLDFDLAFAALSPRESAIVNMFGAGLDISVITRRLEAPAEEIWQATRRFKTLLAQSFSE